VKAAQTVLDTRALRETAAESWLRALADPSEDAAVRALRDIYREFHPTQGELIFTGACEFRCAHCIYPPGFAAANRTMSIESWREALQRCDDDLRLGTYVYGGRSLPAAGLDLLAAIREISPRANLGAIDNGISMGPLRERLGDLKLDWIDVSLDGTEADHDRQRGRSGSFQKGLEGARWLRDNDISPKVNILTCLTTLNRNSVTAMIHDLNAEGFKNFFITPVTVVEGVRPSADLRLSADAFAAFIGELRAACASLDDAWVEVNMFATEYAEYMATNVPEIWAAFAFERDGLSWHETHTNSNCQTATDLWINYYPSSLTGTREFIVNTNGDVIVPKSMAAGKIAAEHVLGNVLKQSPLGIVKALPGSREFDFYVEELLLERKKLKRYTNVHR
jgi:sulfatase maturation enzyme AslB (radical SAM superfamily)